MPSRTVLVLGSAPDVLRARSWPRAGIDRIVAINNAWGVRDDWDHLVHPKDFPPERRPRRLAPGQSLHSHPDYLPAVNAAGGIVYCGGTMAFVAGYWALHALAPRLIAYLGCDMVYPAARPSHFYGTGRADPLRPDPTLQSLEAKAARLMLTAAARGCAVVNLSEQADSRLVFPRLAHGGLAGWRAADSDALCAGLLAGGAAARVAGARAAEARLGCEVPCGRYWKRADRLDPAALARIDALWLAAAGAEALAA